MRWLDSEKLEQAVAYLLDKAKKDKIDAHVSVGASSGFEVSVQNRKTQTVEFNQDSGVSLEVYDKGRKASVSSNDISEKSLSMLFDQAKGLVSYMQPDDCAGLPDEEVLAKTYPTIKLHDNIDISVEQATSMALEMEDAALAVSKDVAQIDRCSVDCGEGYAINANTRGFMGAYPTSRAAMVALVIARRGASMERDYDYCSVRRMQDMISAKEVGQLAANKTLRRLEPRKIKSAKVPVVFDSTIAGSIWSNYLGAVSGSRLYRNSSFLQNSLGQSVFPAWLNIDSDPHIDWAFGSAPFDNEGVQNKAMRLVADGKCESYLLSSYSSRKLKMPVTGHAGGAYNVLLPTTMKLSQMLEQIGTGFLVTDVMGQGVNMVTGDYSRGASGFWIENGKVAYPVHEATIAGNLKDMFANIRAIADDTEKRTSIHTGSVWIDSMTVAG